MEYKKIKGLSAERFRRLTGVKPAVFLQMVDVLQQDENARRLRGGFKKRLLSVEDRLLLMLEYWREYRTHFHMAQSRGISESQVWKIIRRCEDVLIKSGKFALPGRKALRQSDMSYEVILIDATESPVERPKKSSAGGIQERKSATR